MNETNNLAQRKCEPIIIGDVSASPFFSFFNADNMEIMAQYPDKYFDLAIVDPPYGIERFKKGSLRFDKNNKHQNGIEWDNKPLQEYWDELFRISNNQIVFGANNFTMPPSEYFLIWNKHQTVDNFASAEYAWVSMGLKTPAKVFDFSIHKHNQVDKIHPTQKPIDLYDWIIRNYSKPNQKIIDTHLGSGSIALAIDKANKLDNMNLEFVGIELDTEYFNAAVNRFRLAHAQSCLSF